MLKSRVLTSVVLIPLVLAGIYLLELNLFALFTGLISVLGAREWARMSGFGNNLIAQSLYMAIIAAVMAGLFLFASELPALVHITMLTGFAWWFVATAVVMLFPKSQPIWQSKWFNLVIGLVVLVPMWQGLVLLKAHEYANWLITVLLVLIWGADSGAYFSGRKFGKRKLAPNVSPGKTWEGVYGAMATALLIGAVAVYFIAEKLNWTNFEIVLWAGVVLLTVVLSVVGDLTESMLKRISGMKDSGRLLPGHGGVMDRIDSLCAAVPVFVASLTLASML
jgi:phosphatidate cytidylyltransferase